MSSDDSMEEINPPQSQQHKWSEESDEESEEEEMPENENEKFLWSVKNDQNLFVSLLEENKKLAFAKAEDNYTVLHMASSEGKLEAVKLLILAGAHVNALNDDGWTPLHCACRVF